MKKVLITRPADVAAKMAERLLEHRFECVLDPMLIPQPLENVTFMERMAEDGYIFTSPRAVKYFAEIADHFHHHIPAYCVGPKTSQMAANVGFTNVKNAEGGANELALLINKNCASGARLLHPCGEHVADGFYETLRAAGLEVAPLRIYSMKKAPRMQEDALVEIRTDDIFAAVFFSVRTAEAFAALTQEHGLEDCIENMHAVCISQAVADKVGKQNWLSVNVAKHKTEDGLIEALMTLREKEE